MVKSEDDAKELLQDVFFKVWTKRDFIDVEQSFRSYLFQIAKYTVYNHIRRKKLEDQILDYIYIHSVEGYTHIEEELLYKENEEWLLGIIERLPLQRKRIFKLCKIEGKSYIEVSELLGISTSTINDHIVKATRFIREQYRGSDSAILLVVGILLIEGIISI
jgi:RNA polymerase sigma-70 factor (ECF subfamily)